MKNAIPFLLIFFVGTMQLQAQEEVSPWCGCPYTRIERDFAQEMNISLVVDNAATFVGGEKALQRYEHRLIQNPAKNAADSASYSLLCRFVVELNGSISHVELLNHSDAEFETEARRFLQTMPRWTPAQKDGKKVRSWHLLRLYFGYPDTQSASVNKQ